MKKDEEDTFEVFYNAKLCTFDEVFPLDLKMMKLRQEQDESLSRLRRNSIMKRKAEVRQKLSISAILFFQIILALPAGLK